MLGLILERWVLPCLKFVHLHADHLITRIGFIVENPHNKLIFDLKFIYSEKVTNFCEISTVNKIKDSYPNAYNPGFLFNIFCKFSCIFSKHPFLSIFLSFSTSYTSWSSSYLCNLEKIVIKLSWYFVAY